MTGLYTRRGIRIRYKVRFIRRCPACVPDERIQRLPMSTDYPISTMKDLVVCVRDSHSNGAMTEPDYAGHETRRRRKSPCRTPSGLRGDLSLTLTSVFSILRSCLQASAVFALRAYARCKRFPFVPEAHVARDPRLIETVNSVERLLPNEACSLMRQYVGRCAEELPKSRWREFSRYARGAHTRVKSAREHFTGSPAIDRAHAACRTAIVQYALPR